MKRAIGRGFLEALTNRQVAVLALEYCGPVFRDLLDPEECHSPRAVGALERPFFHTTRWALSAATPIEIFLFRRGTQTL